MRAGRTWPPAAALIVVLAFAAPAAAHVSNLGSSWLTETADHPGWYRPSTSSKTDNFEMVGSVERTRRDSTYRNSDLAFWGRFAYAGHQTGAGGRSLVGDVVGYLEPHGANTWSAYWHNGHIFTNDGGRGVDVLRVRDSAVRGSRHLPYSNPQTMMGALD